MFYNSKKGLEQQLWYFLEDRLVVKNDCITFFFYFEQ